MKKKIKRKGETGITLIALIITIIVLLILAGVSISMVVGDNGILSQATGAADSTDIAEIKEAIELGVIGYLDSNGNYTISDVEQAVADAGATLDGTTVTTAKGNTFDISDLIAGAGVSWEYDDDGNVTNGSVTLAIGDYIDYDPTNYDGYDADTAIYTSEKDVNGYETQVFSVATYVNKSGMWRVLGADEDTGELLIISDDIIGPDSGGYTWTGQGETYFYLYGQAGYVNGDSELNNISSLFGNGYGATGARSVSIEDIDKVTGYDPEEDSYRDDTIWEYGATTTYTKNDDGYIEYSISNGLGETTEFTSFIYYDESTKSWKELETGESKTYTQEAYWYYPDILTGDTNVTEVTGISTDSTAYDMLFRVSQNSPMSDSYKGTTDSLYYWVSGSCVGNVLNNSSYYRVNLGFSMRCVECGYVYGYYCFNSGGGSWDYCDGVRPVVSLSSGISLVESTSGNWSIE